MKYTYAYKTSDGVRHEAVIDAESRDAAFAALRGRGIRPIKVVAADGSKANGEIPPPRVPRLASIGVIVVIVALSAWVGGSRLSRLGSDPTAGTPSLRKAAPRHQIYGDPVVVGAFERGDFAAYLPRLGDRMLAVFAQPGKLMCTKGADPRRLSPKELESLTAYVAEELATDKDIPLAADDVREVRELKQIVNGMREEMRGYLANGNGTPRSFWRRLNERTAQEMQIYERTRRELEKETSEEAWEQKNDALRRLGLRTIPNPNE